MCLENKIEGIPIKDLAKKSFRKNMIYGSLAALSTLASGYGMIEEPEHLAVYGILASWMAIGSATCFYLARNARIVVKGQENDPSGQ